jgi:hypothetical protein
MGFDAMISILPGLPVEWKNSHDASVPTFSYNGPSGKRDLSASARNTFFRALS